VIDAVIPEGAIFDEIPLNFCNRLLHAPMTCIFKASVIVAKVLIFAQL